MGYSKLKKQYLEKCIEDINRERIDIQGLITHGYMFLPSARYLLLEISNAQLAKDHLNSLIETHITDAEEIRSINRSNGEMYKTAVQIAFTGRGLKRLELPDDVLCTFSREFLEGMSYDYPDPRNPNARIKERPTLLGDVGSNDPENWHWGSADKPVDCVLMLYANNQLMLDELTNAVYPGTATGLKLVHSADTYTYNPNKSPKEHFGFMDGISQPIVAGFPKSDDEKYKDNLVNSGEFILGHGNAYNTFSPRPFVEKNKVNKDLHELRLTPQNEMKSGKISDLFRKKPDPDKQVDRDKKDLGMNGTYLVFRQMEQHVERFWNYMYHHSREDAPTVVDRAIKLASKMVGRWPEGQSLAVPRKESAVKADLNNFKYNDKDKYGLGCPFGAHIRRANPRDQVHAGRDAKVSLEMSNKHRMLRRGKLYGDPLDPDFNIEKMIDMVKDLSFETDNELDPAGNPKDRSDKKIVEIKRGIHFICLVSDISRQFEFVQSVWANTRTFGNLDNEVDPIISLRHKNDDEPYADFTTPQPNIRNRYKAVPEFTNVIGGAYFFMPGFKTLRYLLGETAAMFNETTAAATFIKVNDDQILVNEQVLVNDQPLSKG